VYRYRHLSSYFGFACHVNHMVKTLCVTGDPQHPLLAVPKLFLGHLQQRSHAWLLEILDTHQHPRLRATFVVANQHYGEVAFRDPLVITNNNTGHTTWQGLGTHLRCPRGHLFLWYVYFGICLVDRLCVFFWRITGYELMT
jgi:hypothetical protein